MRSSRLVARSRRCGLWLLRSGGFRRAGSVGRRSSPFLARSPFFASGCGTHTSDRVSFCGWRFEALRCLPVDWLGVDGAGERDVFWAVDVCARWDDGGGAAVVLGWAVEPAMVDWV